jgi:excisionase family DNA binding protein
MKKRQLLNQVQAADLLGISVYRLAKWLDKGLIPFVKIGRVRKVDHDALIGWYEGQIVSPGNAEGESVADALGDRDEA